MKKELLFLLWTLQAFAVVAQGDYRQVAARFRDFYNRQQSDSIFSMYSSNVQQMLPLDKTRQMVTQLHRQYGALQSADLIHQDTAYGAFKAAFDHAILKMTLALDKDGHIAGMNFVPYQQNPSAGSQTNGGSNISLKTEQGNIYGILEIPQGNKKMPVILVIAGSGPTDRNGNSSMGVNSNVYKMLADSLLRHGIASLRYDKRGVGESKAAVKSESSVKFEDMINDAASFIKMLKADGRFSKVIVLGHSEGSFIGMIAAGREGADAYVSVAGAGERIDKIIERQLAAESPKLASEATLILDSLSKGYTVREFGKELAPLFPSSVQPYWISLLQYDPQEEIKKLTLPVLIIQGTTDIQVSTQDAQLLKKAKPEAVLKLVEGMNHVLKQAGADRQENIATYNMPDLPLNAELVEDIVAFVYSDSK